MADLRVLVVDDEPLARKGVRRALEGEPDVEVVGEAGDGVSALAAIEELSPHVVFLDVAMPERSGLEALEAMPPEARPEVVFVTAYDRHAVRAFDLHAVDYVLKPFDDERLLTALRRVRERLARRMEGADGARAGGRRAADEAGAVARDAASGGTRLQAVIEALAGGPARIAVRTGQKVRWVDVAGVDWIEASGNYAVLHEGGREHLVRETLTSLEARLGPRGFARIHRSTLVNVDRVAELRPLPSGDARLGLTDGTVLRVSRTCREAFEARMAEG